MTLGTPTRDASTPAIRDFDTMPHDLMTEFVARYPAQPATAFWRGIEIEVLARSDLPEGLGLDLGCGDGILTDILFRRMGRKPDLVGIDPDPLETEAARTTGLYARVHTCFGNDIPEPDATFDYVISNSVLEHIPDLEPVIREASRVLKPGGRFYFTVPSPEFRRNLRGSVWPGISRESYLETLDRRLAHVSYLSRADWKNMCERNGLALDRSSGYLSPAQTRRWETLSRMTGGLLHSLSMGRSRPIEIQRSMGLRQLQNRRALPRGAAAALARAVVAGVGEEASGIASCLLVEGHRVQPS